MKIKVMPRVEDIDVSEIRNSNVIVIDMLRATSVIVTAFKEGADAVIPVLEIEEALKMKNKCKNPVLGGERKGLKIDGFDFGNSPLEYKAENIEGKTLIMTTSNGTRAIRGSIDANHIYIGSMLNGRAAAAKAAGQCDVSIVCAGTLGNFSLDDFLCSGYIIDELLKLQSYDLNDISFLAHHTYMENQHDLSGFLSNASHYRYLASLGFKDDLDYCCTRGIIDLVPEFKDGKITVL